MRSQRSAETGGFRTVVDGDATVDWNLARTSGLEGQAICASGEGGGAILLGRLVAAVAEDLVASGRGRVEVDAPKAPEIACPTDEHLHHRFAIWAGYTENAGEDKGGRDAKKRQAWRLENDLGVERSTAAPRPASSRPPAPADLIVLHDGALGFRRDSATWPASVVEADEGRPWILLRMAKPVAEGALWKRLQPLADRLIVVVHIDDLRLGTVRITRELSWERTAQDLMWELLYNPQISPLGQCAHVVVSFTTAGALVFPGVGETSEGQAGLLVFDPAVMERMWNERHPGSMIGGVSALTAGIARQVMLDPENPNVTLGVHRGIAAMRSLDLDGYEPHEKPSGSVRVAYPLDRIAKVLSGTKRPFAETEVREPSRNPSVAVDGPRQARPWTILEDRHRGDLERLAIRIVTEGAERALPDVPMGRFGDLLTFDREEIEGLQSIRTLIRQYANRKRPSQPLSLAVFGPPGSGKSWSVKQVAGAVLPDGIEPIAFNLSQFDQPKELIDALHRVRDISLGGKLPLVLWDEFDSTRSTVGGPQELGWLSHFLSPMEDGEFQDGQVTHPIGRAVFVFAGGICRRMHAFVEDSQRAKEAKAPDFVSRLSGYVDVAGPNPRDDSGADPYYLVRRAVLLRAMLELHAEAIFRRRKGVKQPNIDEGVLRALLLTKEYRHGARSVTSIIATSVVRGRDRLERSDLASEAQLDLHVDARNFLGLVNRPEIEGEMLERLAEAVHVLYCAERLARGESWGESNDAYLLSKPLLRQYAGHRRDGAAANPTLLPYEKLAEARRRSLREEVRSIPNRLASSGYIMRPVRPAEPLVDLVDMRCALESAALERAAVDADPAQMAQARAALAEMRREGITTDEFHDADVRFHVALAGASRNEAMHLLMLAVRDAIAAHLVEALRAEENGEVALRRLTAEHDAILHAVENHEGERAAELVRAHITGFYGGRLVEQAG